MSKLRFLDNGAIYPKEVRRIELGDYHESLKGDFIEAWVNWPRRMSDLSLSLAAEAQELNKLPLGEERDKALVKFNERLLPFHSEWLDIPIEQIHQLYEIDTILYDWIVEQATIKRGEYRDNRKKVEESSTPT